ncbi:MAG: CDP-2,3-bis-(O-geranylgeranyl)-sn-glycerol synthase [Candidatus Nanoarchaeia archaeon]
MTLPILNIIAQAILFILPAYFANASPVVIGKLTKGKWPIDFGKKFFDNRPIFGPGKTWPGLFAGISVGTFVALLQHRPLIVGFLLALGALLGDLTKSFFKRRLGIESGKPWPIADQLDFTIGALLLVSIVEKPSLEITATILILTPLIHLCANIIAYLLKLKKEWY